MNIRLKKKFSIHTNQKTINNPSLIIDKIDDLVYSIFDP
jgi:hypothetical protein